MSQFSVPSSTISDATFADPGNSAAQAPVGAASLWQALANPDEGSYTQQEANAVAAGIAQGVIVVGMQTVDDPLVNTGHTIRIVVRGTLADNGPTGVAGWQAVLIGGPSLFFKEIVVYNTDSALLPPPDFTEIAVPFTEQEVIDFRAAGGYDECSIDLTSSAGCSGGGDTGDCLIEVAFVQLEVPDANPLVHEIVGDISLEINTESEVDPLSVIGNIELEIEVDSPDVSSDIIGDISLLMEVDAESGGTDVVGDIALEIEIEPTLVLSTDISGVYTLVPGKREDTLYHRDQPETTIDVKIPDPTWKTYYSGG